MIKLFYTYNNMHIIITCALYDIRGWGSCGKAICQHSVDFNTIFTLYFGSDSSNERAHRVILSINSFTCKSTCWTRRYPCAFMAILTKVWHLVPKLRLASIVADNQDIMVIISVNHLTVYNIAWLHK